MTTRFGTLDTVRDVIKDLRSLVKKRWRAFLWFQFAVRGEQVSRSSLGNSTATGENQNMNTASLSEKVKQFLHLNPLKISPPRLVSRPPEEGDAAFYFLEYSSNDFANLRLGLQ